MVFVSGNMPFKTEIAPVLIVGRLEEFAYAEATAIAVVLLRVLVRAAGSDQPARTLEQAEGVYGKLSMKLKQVRERNLWPNFDPGTGCQTRVRSSRTHRRPENSVRSTRYSVLGSQPLPAGGHRETRSWSAGA